MKSSILQQNISNVLRCGGKKKGMTVDQLVEFLNKEQRDPRLNEILYPYANPARARDIIRQYEPNKSMAQKVYTTMPITSILFILKWHVIDNRASSRAMDEGWLGFGSPVANCSASIHQPRPPFIREVIS
ncbi:1-phosphatidylinositol 4,5-bisphosphate phosphodiesterase classes I and II [Trichonephila clavipes]|nr:1-phosphatidylinositol 4,5-bisphosphate phosphodiesterase classes I and II [Trichonephila clavipes]